ncbi:NADH-quinone oxidoreductase subunit NuoE [Tabrizicola caldifontis]|uniref:NADH-quinone oxidoreductase subunit NuoE n=1 Tax=Tabrizicola caldifontis TaxID=2528036 RepID=UPI00108207CE|nr:NADH-quinone oxidoreductase subunit NuoE [Rhodobacter sp. YIM 73028]
MLRRLHHTQPESFAFTPANLEWAKGQITKYPEGRQASAIIPLLWRAQEQEGWLSRPAIEYVADMLGMPYIRALEVATFYFMFQLQPVGSVAHIQICGTTSCMICGAEDLIAVCKELIAPTPHTLSADGKFSWEEVECLGACANAPMAQIGKDYYEDLTAGKLRELIARFSVGEVPVPGSQIGRYAAEPAAGLTSLTEFESGRTQYNASVQLAVDIGDTVKRIDGTEVPLSMPWLGKSAKAARPAAKAKAPAGAAAPDTPAAAGVKPATLAEPRDGKGDDLTMISGVGPKLQALCQKLGFWHFDQIAAWTPAEVAWVDANLEGFKGRVTRDNWVAQAKVLAAGGSVEDAHRAAKV